MIKEAIQHLQNAHVPALVKGFDRQYIAYNGILKEIHQHWDLIAVQTLQGILGFTHAKDCPVVSFINILSPTHIVGYGKVGENGRLQSLFVAQAKTKEFPYGKQLSMEDFILNIQVCFAESDDKTELLSAVSRVVQSSQIVQEDDGITQTLEVKSGIALKETKRISPVRSLAAYRSFPGFASPEAPFLFRAHKDEKGVKFSLTDMAGDNWIGLTMEALRVELNYILDNNISLV
jgi:hypothetical protein